MDLCPLFDDVVVTQLDGELDVFPPEIKWNVYFQISKPLKATIFI
jgi:hypothetical protein